MSHVLHTLAMIGGITALVLILCIVLAVGVLWFGAQMMRDDK